VRPAGVWRGTRAGPVTWEWELVWLGSPPTIHGVGMSLVLDPRQRGIWVLSGRATGYGGWGFFRKTLLPSGVLCSRRVVLASLGVTRGKEASHQATNLAISYSCNFFFRQYRPRTAGCGSHWQGEPKFQQEEASKTKRRETSGNRVWSGRAGGSRYDKDEEKRERREMTGSANLARPARPGTHMPGRNEMQKELGGARAPEFSSTVRTPSLSLATWCGCGVGRQQDPPADATPHPVGHGPPCVCEQKAWGTRGSTRQLRSSHPGRLPWRNGDGPRSGKKHVRRQDATVDVRVPLDSGPRPEVGWLCLLKIPFS